MATATAAEVTEVSKTQVKIIYGFWHSSIGITIKRILIQVLATVLLIAADALNGKVEWSMVLYAVRGQIAYLLISTAQTLKDSSIPNTGSEEITIKK